MNNDTSYDHLLWGVRRSVRYHDRRSGFFRGCHVLVMVVVLLAGSSSAAAIFSAVGAGGGDLSLHWQLLSMGLITLLTTLDLAIGFSGRAWRYADLKRRFIELEQKLVTREQPSADDLAALTQERLAIEMDEPPVLRVLDILCHNELLVAMDRDRADLVQVGFLQRRLAHFFDLGINRLQRQ